MKKVIWTDAYRPFIMGGDLHAPIGAEVEVSDIFNLGGGFCGHIAVSPSGHTKVVEATTGAIVGDSVDQVKRDIAEAEPVVMHEQVQQAATRVHAVRIVSPSTFWKSFR